MNMTGKPLQGVLSYELQPRKDVLIVHVRGRAGFDQTPILDCCIDEVRETTQPRILFDLSELNYIGSSGLGALVRLKQAVEPHHRKIMLAGLNPMVLDLFETAGLTRIFPVFDTPQEALEKS
jgi:anti-sigma B factor antagonist